MAERTRQRTGAPTGEGGPEAPSADAGRAAHTSRYAEAGVDLSRAQAAKERIRALVTSTFTEGVAGSFGAFAGGFDLARSQATGRVLVASTDGVGTKLLVALAAGRHDTVGEDLVNHCVNDILVAGARPLFFLDYIGCARMEPGRIAAIVEGVARGCRANGCALLGGETAEMPGLYRGDDYDLAGFIVGAVEAERRLDGSAIRPGDLVLGLASSGLHTNGFSLARKIVFEERGLGLDDQLPGTGRTVAEALLAVHRSYLRPVGPLHDEGLVNGLVHVTGGGFEGNIPRVLPRDVDCEIDAGSWEPPALFRFLAEAGGVPDAEMYRVFNMGIGMLLFVDARHLERARALLAAAGEAPVVVGRAVDGSGRVRLLLPHGGR
ncbi:MAG TPA: phosphoribosylformylglycinamidine cyclo-ligase [Gemmatimonadota bacterium]|jgi:phosphoribosylformylglycinamidine cyclo-ligase